MKSFFKFFFAAFLALIIFSLIGLFIVMGIIGGLSPKETVVSSNSVLVLDLNTQFAEQEVDDPLAQLTGDNNSVPGVYDLARIIRKAAQDTAVKALYIKSNGNPNGFATSEEIRNAIIDFRSKKKTVIAFGEYITQKSYFVINAANKVYLHPKGGMEWTGLSSQMPFVKGTLEKLSIQPQIFYAGKFKSATEPLREYKMTEANKIQTREMLEDMYKRILVTTSEARQIDTASLRSLADAYAIRSGNDALRNRLIDGLKYDDEVKAEIRRSLNIGKDAAISFISISKYGRAINYRRQGSGNDRIAIIYAEGNIVPGKGEEGEIGSDTYRALISKARTDKQVKAIVFRINSGGGSSLASESIWRELSLARKEKPVVVSFGDVAASGGYYIACGADSIFAQPNTITGSIGVFGIVFNMQQFMSQKLGVTFDGVKTSPMADMGNAFRPLTAAEGEVIQQEIDTIYLDFKSRVAEARKLSLTYVDSIAQGRVWTGQKALQLKLVDKLGNIDDAVACAARMASLKEYRFKEFPEQKDFFQKLFGQQKESIRASAMKEELGAEGYLLYQQTKYFRKSLNQAQMRLPYDFIIQPGRFSVE